jgi:uncharacterized membrane protein YqjE
MAAGAERPISEILQDITSNVQEIIRSEVRLAKAELKREAGTAAKAGLTLLVGIVTAVYAGAFLLLALIYGLAVLLASWWIAALIVGGGLAIIAAALLAVGRGRMRTVDPAPERTIRTVKENLAWDKSRTR